MLFAAKIAQFSRDDPKPCLASYGIGQPKQKLCIILNFTGGCSMSKKQRRKFNSEEKLSILKRHLQGKEAVSDICEEMGLAPNQFYRWQKEFFDNGAVAFEKNGRSKRKEATKVRILEEKVEKLQAKLSYKDNVIAEITEDYVKLKKNFGET
jgi:transposase